MPVVNENHATLTINGQPAASGVYSQAIDLNVGDNTITVVVTAQDGTTTRTYTVTVTRQAPLSSDATLSNLALSSGTLNPIFAPATTTYTASVANSVASVNVTATVNESHATVTVNGQTVTSGQPSQAIDLNVGDNTINVVVTAQDGTTTKTCTVSFLLPALTCAETAVQAWVQRYNGPGNGHDYPNAVVVDGSSNIVVTGHSLGSVSSYDHATIKYSSVGVPLWTNRYNGPANGPDTAYSLAVDGSNNIVVTGFSSNGTNDDYATIKSQVLFSDFCNSFSNSDVARFFIPFVAIHCRILSLTLVQ